MIGVQIWHSGLTAVINMALMVGKVNTNMALMVEYTSTASAIFTIQ